MICDAMSSFDNRGHRTSLDWVSQWVLTFVLLSSIVLTGEQRFCLKRFPSYVIPPYRAVSFVVVRHHRLGDNYWAAISYRLGLIALPSFGGVYFVGTHDAFGLRTGNRFLLVTDEVTYTFYICSVV